MRPLKWLVWLAVLAALGLGLWRAGNAALAFWHDLNAQAETVARLENEVRQLKRDADELNRHDLELQLAGRQGGASLAALGARVDAAEQNVQKLGDAVEGGRTRLTLLAAEQLMLAAADRAQLARDAAGARAALDAADERLAKLNDPRLFKVREALKAERDALAAASGPDVTALSLALNDLLRAAPKLPLRGRAAEHYEPPAPTLEAGVDEGFVARAYASVKWALSNIFSLHRIDVPPPRWLPPEQQELVAQVLLLKLEGARLALLARDGVTLRELAGGARDWLERWYDDTDPAVKQAAAQLEPLRRVNFAQPAPEIGRSLALLRAATNLK